MESDEKIKQMDAMEKENKTCEYCGVHSDDNNHGSNCRLKREFKTLKDLKDIADIQGVSTTVFCLRLKAESMKWYHRSDGNKHKFIKHFFNITEEDLNDTNAIQDEQ